MSASAAACLQERNAANAQFSTGPATAEGKSISSRNALRHGLTSRTIVLPHESQEDFDALKISFVEQYDPGTSLEREMVNRMAECWWKLVRANRVEAEFFNQRGQAICESNPDLGADAALASMFCNEDEGRKFRLFMRYYTSAQNTWKTISSEYTQTRRARLERDRENAMFEAMLTARMSNYEEEDDEDEEALNEEELHPEHDDAETSEADAPTPDPKPAKASSTPSGFVSKSAVMPEETRPFPGVPRARKVYRLAEDTPATRL